MKDPADITQEETEYWEDRAEAKLGEPPFMDYKAPKQSGFNASLAGVSNLDCPADYRTQANARTLWIKGWEAGQRAKKCKGIQLNGPRDRSGCGMKSGNYPMGDCPECI